MIAVKPLMLPASHDEPKILYVGIDVSKGSHVAALMSRELLEKHRKFEKCPTLSFENNRAGFEKLARAMQAYAPLEYCVALWERTGHYHRALAEYLAECGVSVYDIQVQQRQRGSDKSDQRDARVLANTLYTQVALGAQINEPWRRIRHVVPPSAAAVQLRGLVLHRYSLVSEATQRKNQLTAIADQLFPEAGQVIKDLNSETALNLREKFATIREVAQASIEELRACCLGTKPGIAALTKLQDLARISIAVKDPARIDALVFEKRQLIRELRVINEHIEAIDARITEIVEGCREGQILTSFPMIGAVAAAAIIAHVGSIGNFESAASLRRYFGWSPSENQTGVTMDHRSLSRAGSHVMKKTLYLIAWTAIQGDTEWKALYERLLPKKCQWDARLQRYRGKNKVIGRICGSIVALIYCLLRKDYDLIANLEPGEDIPVPTLYDRALHSAHKARHRKEQRDTA